MPVFVQPPSLIQRLIQLLVFLLELLLGLASHRQKKCLELLLGTVGYSLPLTGLPTLQDPLSMPSEDHPGIHSLLSSWSFGRRSWCVKMRLSVLSFPSNCF